jgi:hypothetical protein
MPRLVSKSVLSGARATGPAGRVWRASCTSAGSTFGIAVYATSGRYERWRTDCPGREAYGQHQCLVNRDNHAIQFLNARKGNPMNNIIYIVGVVVIIVAILGFFGLR